MKESKTPLTDDKRTEICVAFPLKGNNDEWFLRFNEMEKHALSLELQLAEAKQTINLLESNPEEYTDLLKQLDQLAARVMELEKVLEWLDKHKWRKDGNCDINSAYSWNMSVPTGEDYYEPGKELPLLEAIEAAIAKEK